MDNGIKRVKKPKSGFVILASFSVIVTFVLMVTASAFADSNRDRSGKHRNSSAKRSCPPPCRPAKNAKDIRRHAACVARRARLCR